MSEDISNQPLRQLEGDHAPVTVHTVDDETNVVRDEYHNPGTPQPNEAEDAATAEQAAVTAEYSQEPAQNEDPSWYPAVDTRSAEHAYATKDNIVKD